jgi:hypothetical protein
MSKILVRLIIVHQSRKPINSEITLQKLYIMYENIYPFPIRNLGAVVAVRKCSPSGDQ